jgi:hypothetical protein
VTIYMKGKPPPCKRHPKTDGAILDTGQRMVLWRILRMAWPDSLSANYTISVGGNLCSRVILRLDSLFLF